MEIIFRTKQNAVRDSDGNVVKRYLKVPVLLRKHVNMDQARRHPKYGPFANSDLFLGYLAHIKKEWFPSGKIDLENVPDGVTVRTLGTTGFMMEVRFEV